MTTATLADLILVVPAKPDAERGAVAQAWQAGGGSVQRLERFWDPPELPSGRVRLYGSDAFCLVLAHILELELVSPPDEWLVTLPETLTKRRIARAALHQLVTPETSGVTDSAGAIGFEYPVFVKPLTPKLFRAQVYDDPDDLRAETDGLGPETGIAVSEVVTFDSEVRAWVLHDEVLSCASYEGQGDEREARAFVERVTDTAPLPVTCVVDVGEIRGRGWAVIEANPAWGAGLNGCEPAAAARCLAAATVRLGAP